MSYRRLCWPAWIGSAPAMLVATLLGASTHVGADTLARKAGEAFDAAPFGVVENSADGTVYGVRWAEPRKIRRLVVEFASDTVLRPGGQIRVQYWHNVWDGKSDPVLSEVGASRFGWTPIDDWSNGRWKDADTEVAAEGRRWVFKFQPTGNREFRHLGQRGVSYRKTLKVRIISDRPMSPPLRVQALTDAVYRPLTVRISWDVPAVPNLLPREVPSGRLDVFNGTVLSVRPLTGTDVPIDHRMQWKMSGRRAGGIEAELMTAVDLTDEHYDRTIVTIRTKGRPFSFAAADVACGERILVDDLGALVTRGDDAITLSDYRRQRCESPRMTVYDRIFQHSEQTLANAWNEMPPRRQLYFVHGLPGNRNVFRQEPNGEVAIVGNSRWFNLPRSSRDTDRRKWDGNVLAIDPGLPAESHRGGRELREGYLPELRTWWLDGPIYYEQTTLLDKLGPGLEGTKMDDPTLLLMRVHVLNTSSSKAIARLTIGSRDTARETLVIEGDRVMSRCHWLRCMLRTGGRGTAVQSNGAIAWSMPLMPAESHTLLLLIPSITLTEDKEISALRGRDFDTDSRHVCDFWKNLTARSAEIETPEPWLNDFYRAHLRHMEINCIRDRQAPRRYPKVSSFSYGVFANESVMMTTDLDRRGCHQAAEQCLQPWLDFQGTAALPGDFKTREGVFYGAGGWEDGGYNKHHGYVMWGMAEHWHYTRDRVWMERAADKLVNACDWVTRERQATMTQNADGTRLLFHGLLPAGALEDVKDYWYWLATNASTVWGFVAVADALADYGHPAAARLQKDAAAYREDVLRTFTEARIGAPVVRLRDGTYVPKYPSRALQRGRDVGWLRETLEGSLFLLTTDLIAPQSPEATWIVKDYEDNLYISNLYGYSIPTFDQFWFSRGGFSMQANLLDGPLCYLKRDEIQHFLRAFFNGFASAFFPEGRMLNEHSQPELGYPVGDHYKTSDEAQVTYWLRLMFIHEQGNDLCLGQAIPRGWLADGKRVAIRRAATWFGPMSLEIESHAATGEIRARFTPPERNRPKTVYLRLRHPDGKPIRSVMLGGREYSRFDAVKEWIVLPGDLEGAQEIVARY
jgi:hypothetical protein